LKDVNGPLDEVSTLQKLFGENRAEWPPESFRDLFVPPTYISKLESMRPCILVGGRGTGKTTTLQSLGYSETLERLEANDQSFSDQRYFGVLVRMNKNRVHAFKGSELETDAWGKVFAHYFNLLVCLELTKLAEWLEEKTEKSVDTYDVSSISTDLGLGNSENFNELRRKIKAAISQLQIYVNNPHIQMDLVFSVAESPLRVFSEVLEAAELLGDRVIFCCIDEYENLLDYQQGVINTYIKHASRPLSYKIGVRKFGIRNWKTIDKDDLLSNPDDFEEIKIVDEGFEYFATAVADRRLDYALKKGIKVATPVKDFLVNITLEEEAMRLGAKKVAEEVIDELKHIDMKVSNYIQGKKSSEVYFLKYWQEKEGGDLIELALDFQKNEAKWETRLGNHGYASLFWLSKGKKGLRIKKYYSGINTILSLAGGNIRYFLQLIHTSIYYEVGKPGTSFPSLLKLSAESQTLALKDIGKRRLDQLEGLSDHGVELRRLVLAIGKVFFELARTPANRTPEVVSFVVSGDTDDMERISMLLEDGVGHLAFEVAPRTKNTSNLEIRDDEFRLHRIFSGFFEISHRKKRRATFKAKDLLSVIDDTPSAAISALLSDQNVSTQEELPEQLAFFSAFYNGS
jgi:hypothetical protein